MTIDATHSLGWRSLRKIKDFTWDMFRFILLLKVLQGHEMLHDEFPSRQTVNDSTLVQNLWFFLTTAQSGMLLVDMWADSLQTWSRSSKDLKMQKQRNSWLFISKQHLQNERVKKWNFKCLTKGKALGKHYLLQTWDMFRKTTVPQLLILDVGLDTHTLHSLKSALQTSNSITGESQMPHFQTTVNLLKAVE